jgi:4-hydroxybenzoate polyprenyltransferase
VSIRGESVFARVRTYASFIRLSHTVFALPFALTGSLLAAQSVPLTWGRVGWIVAAMVTARTAAMAFNRLVDAEFDADNPRTVLRELPRGIVSRREAAAMVVVAALAFIGTTFMLGPLCFALSPVALAIVFWYSLAKRFTTYTQLYLGLALAVAPVGGWLAAGGRGGWAPWLLALGTAMWVAGFDILYACEDVAFDRKRGLFSIPARFGVPRALWLSRIFHVATVLSLASVAVVMPLGQLYLLGIVGVAGLLVYEQSMVHADDLSRVKQAFDLNGYVGLLYFVTTAAALYV